jgi:hypothetical protein
MAEDSAHVTKDEAPETEAHDESHGAHDHHDFVPNPDYDGPAEHCLPPPVHNSVGRAIVFGIIILLVVWGGVQLGVHLFGK